MSCTAAAVPAVPPALRRALPRPCQPPPTSTPCCSPRASSSSPAFFQLFDGTQVDDGRRAARPHRHQHAAGHRARRLLGRRLPGGLSACLSVWHAAASASGWPRRRPRRRRARTDDALRHARTARADGAGPSPSSRSRSSRPSGCGTMCAAAWHIAASRSPRARSSPRVDIRPASQSPISRTPIAFIAGSDGSRSQRQQCLAPPRSPPASSIAANRVAMRCRSTSRSGLSTIRSISQPSSSPRLHLVLKAAPATAPSPSAPPVPGSPAAGPAP